VVDQLVERRVAERVVLHLHHGAPAGHAEADRGSEDSRLGERGVDAALGTEPVLKARGGTKDPAELADVLSHHEDGRVALHLDVQRVVHRLDEQELAHEPASLGS
jgi:hypothetical protein